MSLPHNSRCRAPYYDDDDEKKTAADAMKDPDDPDKDRGRSTRTPGQIAANRFSSVGWTIVPITIRGPGWFSLSCCKKAVEVSALLFPQ